ATTGYLGFLTGPPLIGVVAEAIGLGPALGLVSVGCALIAIRAATLSTRDSVASHTADPAR
ncbi:MAG TPA: hypothetical protein VNF03_09645, partial [Patescibacteria group bacterium]|nr:hypothetical protein [Patescibacteria group bacterium]